MEADDNNTTAMAKTHMSVVITGHPDSGKSTTTGHLLCELGGVEERRLQKLKEKAKQLGRESFYFAFLMDTQKDEMDRGMTIKCTTEQFFTPNYHYSIIDAPGHKDFIKNMINGAGQADVGVLLVPADGNFVAAVQKGDPGADGEVMGQTRQHARLLHLLGIKQLIVCVNKMDSTVGDHGAYSQARFEEVRDEMQLMLRQVGFGKQFVANRVPIIPISGWMGDNLLQPSENMPWWEGQTAKIGKGDATVVVRTLTQALDEFVQPIVRDANALVRMPVSGVFNINGVGTVVTGRVEQGTVRCKDEVVFMPTHTSANACTGKVFSIEMHHEKVEVGHAGDNIGINMRGLNKSYMPRVGDVMTLKGDESLSHTQNFVAQVHVLDIPGVIRVGYTPIGFVRTAKGPCRVTGINWRVSAKETGGQKVAGATELKSGDTGEVVLEPLVPLLVDAYESCEGLGRIAFMDGNAPVMLGKVVALNVGDSEAEVVELGGAEAEAEAEVDGAVPAANTSTVEDDAPQKRAGHRGGKQNAMSGDQRKAHRREKVQGA